MWRKQDQPKAPSDADVPAAGESLPESARPVAPAPKFAQEAVPAGSRLTAALRIKGEITGQEDLLIDARVEGRVHLDGATVTVGSSGQIAADVEAGDIVIQG